MAHIIEISDLSAPELAPYTQLTHAQLRSQRDPEKGIFIAESGKVISCALKAGCQPLSCLTESRHLPALTQLLPPPWDNIPIYTAPRDVLARLTGYELTRGMLCAMRRPPLPSPEEICRSARRLVVLENITDSTNIGAIFRSAAALGMDGVLVSSSCCDPLYRRSVRVSMGTVFQIPWTWLHGDAFQWPQPGIATLRSLGFSTAAMATDGQTPSPLKTRSWPMRKSLAIVLGSEGNGLCEETIAHCDYTARIPMYHGVDSLNVAAAGAVIFWQLRAREKN